MTGMVENVARAMASAQGLDWDGKSKGTEYANHGYWLPLARAAIEALREPTPEMLNAAVDATGAGSGMSWVNRSPQTLFAQGHAAMIDAALSPQV